MVLDSPATVLPCSTCGARRVVGGFGFVRYLDCQNGRPFPCSERVRAAAQLDEQIALDLVPSAFPPDAWAMVVRAIVARQRGPVGLPVGGGVLHVLGEREGRGFRAAISYFAMRADGGKFSGRAEMARLGYRDLGAIFDALDVYFARVESPARPDGDTEDASGEGRVTSERRRGAGSNYGARAHASDAGFYRRHMAAPFGGETGMERFFQPEAIARLVYSGSSLRAGGE